MWFLRAIFFLIVLVALLSVLLLNSGQVVSIFVTNPNVPSIQRAPLPWVLLGSFLAGVLVWFIVSLFQVISGKSEVAALRRKNRQLARELTDLRNMPVSDLDPDSLPAGPGEEDDREV